MSEKTTETPSTETGTVSKTPENPTSSTTIAKFARALFRRLMWLFSIFYFAVRSIDTVKRIIKLFREMSDAS